MIKGNFVKCDTLLAFLWWKLWAQKYPSVYLMRNSSHMFFTLKTLCISMEKQFLHWKTVHTASECTTTMEEPLFDLVHQYPAPWDKQDAMYKESNYKDAKWQEIAELLCLTKEDVTKKWKSLRDTFMRHKTSNPKVGMNRLLLTHNTPRSSMKDSQSSASSNRVTTPLPLTPCRRPKPGKRVCYGPKRDAVEEKLLQIIKSKKWSLMKMTCFVLL